MKLPENILFFIFGLRILYSSSSSNVLGSTDIRNDCNTYDENYFALGNIDKYFEFYVYEGEDKNFNRWE